MNRILPAKISSIAFFYVLLSISVTSLSASTSSQDEQLVSTLEKFVRQGDQQLYNGTFVSLCADGLQTIHVTRKKDPQGVILETFSALDNNSPASNRLLNNQYCLMDNGWKYQFQAFSSSFPFRINNNINYLRQNYQFVADKLERVAGVNALHVSLLPDDRFRYGYELWFEPETGILLKYQLTSKRHDIIEQYLFSNIDIESSAAVGGHKNVEQHESEAIPKCSALQPDNEKIIKSFVNRSLLPPGFQIISYRQNKLADSLKRNEQLHLSDGLATVSVFIEELESKARAMEGIAKTGPLTIAGKTMNDHQIIVVGAIPVDAAIKILDSINK